MKITGLRMEDYPKPGTPGSCKMVIDFSLTAKSAGTVGVYFKPFFKGKHSPEYNANSGSPEFSGTTAGIHELYF
ncbi:hypothetical protein HYY75_13105, partial [bacterium]|nr:hypothetical protein [bacterium]